jgi:ABC-type cobalamin/Fe3+-siderophores transport system ATPase subunit
MIKVENLSVSYSDKYVLNSITLEIPDGSWTCIVGPNGAGKTTFLMALLGMKSSKICTAMWHLCHNAPKSLSA